MSSNITLITLGVADVARAAAFYESLGFVKSKTASQDEASCGTAMAAWWLHKMSQAKPRSMLLWQRPLLRVRAY